MNKAPDYSLLRVCKVTDVRQFVLMLLMSIWMNGSTLFFSKEINFYIKENAHMYGERIHLPPLRESWRWKSQTSSSSFFNFPPTRVELKEANSFLRSPGVGSLTNCSAQRCHRFSFNFHQTQLLPLIISTAISVFNKVIWHKPSVASKKKGEKITPTLHIHFYHPHN